MLSAIALFLVTPSQQAAPAFLRHPDIHGNQVAFACEGDIWLGDRTTGKASRLTSSPLQEQYPRFSPDGKWIAFSGFYHGLEEVYVIPVTGGTPRRITYSNDYAWLLDWTPDGRSVIYRSRTFPRSFAISIKALDGGMPERWPLEFAAWASPAPDGKRMVFTRINRADEAWFRYEGGRSNAVWVGDGATFTKIVESRFTNEYPTWVGDRIAFVRDEGNGTFSLMSCQPDGKGLKRWAGPYPFEIRRPQADGMTVVYEKGTTLEAYDPTTGKAEAIHFDLLSDQPHTVAFAVKAEDFVDTGSLGPTGKRVIIGARGQLISVPAKDGDARLLFKKDGARLRHPSLSPDGKQLAYLSDETGEVQLYVATSEGLNPRALTNDTGRQLYAPTWSPDGKSIAVTDSSPSLRLIDVATGAATSVAKQQGWYFGPYEFSPDSKWLVMTQNDQFHDFNRIELYEISTGKRFVVSDGQSDDPAAAFGTDQQYLAMLSRRNVAVRWDAFLNQMGAANPVKVYLAMLQPDGANPFQLTSDEEGVEKKPEKKDENASQKPIDPTGIQDRFIELPVPPGNYTQIDMAGDRVILYGEGTISFYDLKSKTFGTLASGNGFQLSADGKRIAIWGNPIRVLDATVTDAKPRDGAIDFAGLKLTINPRDEWKQMFWDAWRLHRDYFYVRNMHGIDWKAIGNKYAAFLPSIRSRDELTELIRWLQSELATGHMYRNEGDTRAIVRPELPSFLGVDLTLDPSGYYRIAKILRGDGYKESERSPLAAAGLKAKEGHYLIEVAGIPARKDMNFMEGLVGRAGKVVALKINDKPSAEGAWTIHVKPIADERRLRYLDWVVKNRTYVTKASSGKIGYIHLSAMSTNDMADFIKQYFQQRSKDALIIDVRFNGGGNISNNIISVLKQRLVANFNQRGRQVPWTRQSDYFPGPLACLMNEFSASNGEEFPHHFRELKLGPLIGRRTWGGEVGSDPGWPLVDGGTVSVPNYGAFTDKDGWIIEGPGLSPDIDVESDPNAWVKGRDPQIDKAIEVLLAELKRNPVKRPTSPPDPIRIR
ncbi:MAG: Tricorn protease [Fimbriimonadaceae bacterium]|nr:Tricorn protease [Fimbriimonadaceae bacterium]